MAAAADSVVTRDEVERMGTRVTALEARRATADAEALTTGDEVAWPAHDFVRQEEFRLFKWLGTFALATVFGGFALLYEQTSDLRVAMERLHADLLREMHVQHASIREDMHAQHAAIRNGVASLRERVVRLETLDNVEVR